MERASWRALANVGRRENTFPAKDHGSLAACRTAAKLAYGDRALCGATIGTSSHVRSRLPLAFVHATLPSAS
jgi:hypothetical protein